MARLLGQVFSLYDPPAVATGLPAEQIEHLVAAFGPKALAERLSVVARASESGELLGAVLVEDFATPAPSDVLQLAPAFAPIGSMLESLDDRYQAGQHIAPGTHAHIFMVGVARHAGGRGIAQRLIEACLGRARSLGYGVAVTEATSVVSQHIFRKLGFREVLFAPYKDFVFEGQTVFSSITGSESTILMDKEL
jgi:ribosomal protein S18 acetylase RimI-like enzyme